MQEGSPQTPPNQRYTAAELAASSSSGKSTSRHEEREEEESDPTAPGFRFMSPSHEGAGGTSGRGLDSVPASGTATPKENSQSRGSMSNQTTNSSNSFPTSNQPNPSTRVEPREADTKLETMMTDRQQQPVTSSPTKSSSIDLPDIAMSLSINDPNEISMNPDDEEGGAVSSSPIASPRSETSGLGSLLSPGGKSSSSTGGGGISPNPFLSAGSSRGSLLAAVAAKRLESKVALKKSPSMASSQQLLSKYKNNQGSDAMNMLLEKKQEELTKLHSQHHTLGVENKTLRDENSKLKQTLGDQEKSFQEKLDQAHENEALHLTQQKELMIEQLKEERSFRIEYDESKARGDIVSEAFAFLSGEANLEAVKLRAQHETDQHTRDLQKTVNTLSFQLRVTKAIEMQAQRKKIAQKMIEINSLKSEVTKYRSDLQAAETLIQNLRDENERLKAELEKTRRGLRDSEANLQEELQEAARSIANAQNEAQKERRVAEDLRAVLEETSNAKTAHEIRVDLLQKQLEEAEIREKNLSTDFEDEKTKNKTSILELEKDIKASSEREASLLKSLEELKTEKSAEQQRTSSMLKDIEQLRNELLTTATTRSSGDKEAESPETEERKSKTEVADAASDSVTQASSDMTEVQDQPKATERLQDELVSLQAEVRKLNQKLLVAVKVADDAHSELELLTTKAEEDEKLKQEMSDKISSLDEEKGRQQVESEKLSERIAELTRETSGLKNSLIEAEERAKQGSPEQHREIQGLQSRLDQEETSANKLQQQLDARERQLFRHQSARQRAMTAICGQSDRNSLIVYFQRWKEMIDRKRQKTNMVKSVEHLLLRTSLGSASIAWRRWSLYLIQRRSAETVAQREEDAVELRKEIEALKAKLEQEESASGRLHDVVRDLQSDLQLEREAKERSTKEVARLEAELGSANVEIDKLHKESEDLVAVMATERSTVEEEHALERHQSAVGLAKMKDQLEGKEKQLFRHAAARQRAIEVICGVISKNSLLVYFTQWKELARRRRQKETLVKSVEHLLLRTSLGCASVAYRRWCLFIVQQKSASKEAKIQQELVKLIDNAASLQEEQLQRDAKYKKKIDDLSKQNALLDVIVTKQQTSLQRSVESFAHTLANGSQRVAFARWLRFADQKRKVRRCVLVSSSVLQRTEFGVRAHAYHTWLRVAHHRKQSRVEGAVRDDISVAIAQLAEMKAQNEKSELEARTKYESLKLEHTLLNTHSDKKQQSIVRASEVFCLKTNENISRIFYARWLRFVELWKERRRYQRAVEMVAGRTDQGVRNICFRRWVIWAIQKSGRDQARKQRADELKRATTRARLHGAWNNWSKFMLAKRVQNTKVNAASVLLSNSTSRGAMLVRYLQWYRYCLQMRQRRRAMRLVNSFLAGTKHGLRTATFHSWIRWAREASSVKTKRGLAIRVLATHLTSASRQFAFSQWRNFVRSRFLDKQRVGKLQAVQSLMSSTSRGLMVTSFRKLRVFAVDKIHLRDAREAKIDALLEKTVLAFRLRTWKVLERYQALCTKRHLREKVAASFLSSSIIGIQRLRFNHWLTILEKAKKRRVKYSLATAAFQRTVRGRAMVHFSQWKVFANEHKIRRQHRERMLATAYSMASNWSQGATRRYFWNNWRKYLRLRYLQRAHREKQRAVGALLNQSIRGQQLLYYRQWFTYHKEKKIERANRDSVLRSAYGIAAKFTKTASTRYAWSQWTAFLRFKRIRRQQKARERTIRATMRSSDRGLQLVCWKKWSAFLQQQCLMRKHKKTLLLSAYSLVMKGSETAVMRLRWNTWHRLLRIRFQEKQDSVKRKTVAAFLNQTSRGRMVHAWNTWSKFRRERSLESDHKRTLLQSAFALVTRGSTIGRQRIAFQTWRRFLRWKNLQKQQLAKVKAVGSILSSTDRGTRVLYLQRWRLFVDERRKKDSQRAAAYGLVSRTNVTAIRRIMFFTWRRWLQRQKALRFRAGAAHTMLISTTVGRLRAAFHALHRFSQWKGQLRVQQQLQSAGNDIKRAVEEIHNLQTEVRRRDTMLVDNANAHYRGQLTQVEEDESIARHCAWLNQKEIYEAEKAEFYKQLSFFEQQRLALENSVLQNTIRICQKENHLVRLRQEALSELDESVAASRDARQRSERHFKETMTELSSPRHLYGPQSEVKVANWSYSDEYRKGNTSLSFNSGGRMGDHTMSTRDGGGAFQYQSLQFAATLALSLNSVEATEEFERKAFTALALETLETMFLITYRHMSLELLAQRGIISLSTTSGVQSRSAIKFQLPGSTNKKADEASFSPTSSQGTFGSPSSPDPFRTSSGRRNSSRVGSPGGPFYPSVNNNGGGNNSHPTEVSNISYTGPLDEPSVYASPWRKKLFLGQ